MVGKLSLLVTMVFACAVTGMAQAFTYSYTDPCTGKKESVVVDEPNGSITMSYNKFVKTFNIDDFNSGAFDAWITQIKSSMPGDNPCSGIGIQITTETNTQIAMNTVAVTNTILAAVSDAAPDNSEAIAGVSNQRSNDDDESDGSGKTSEKKSNKSKSKSTEKTESGDEKTEGGEPTENTEGSGGGGESNENGENSETSENNQKESSEESGGGESSGGANSANAVSGSSKQKNVDLRKGNLIATGDIVAIQNQTTDDTRQFKINASMIYADSRKIVSYGGLLNFTSAINNSSLTVFGSYRWKKLTTILANSTMVNFEKDLFNTTSLIATYPVWKFGTMAGGNATYGMFGTSSFQSYSALAGLNGTIPMSKLNLNIMTVVLYSPYTFYYEGMWYKTNIILVPFASVDYSVTKTFKFNISFSSVYEVKNNVLNYQILLGGKYLF